MSNKTFSNIKQVAIIGAGPAGIAAAKYLLAERYFKFITIYEQRDNVGGIWNYTPGDNKLLEFQRRALPTPQTNPNASLETPKWLQPKNDFKSWFEGNIKVPTVLSALYDDLECNIPKELMQFSDFPFDGELQLFPKRDEVLDYLEDYAEEVEDLIKLGAQVRGIYQLEGGGWNVSYKAAHMDSSITSTYDAIVFATGHYDIPHIPEIEGLKDWKERYPRTVSHSKFYRRPNEYTGKKVIVVGNSASGLDIGSQIATVCKHPLLVSQRSESYLSPGPTSDKVELPEITKLDADSRTVTFANGHQEAGVDAILFCTGYFYSFPMLRGLEPPLISDGARVQNLYQHIFWRPDPTIAFLALPQKVTPFPIAQVQSAVVARAWSGRLSLPSEPDMREWEQAAIAEQGAGKRFHNLQYPKDAQYINTLYKWAEEAEPREGLERGGKGKASTKWDDRYCWLRERFPAIRKAFSERGAGRSSIKSVEQLGFLYAESH